MAAPQGHVRAFPNGTLGFRAANRPAPRLVHYATKYVTLSGEDDGHGGALVVALLCEPPSVFTLVACTTASTPSVP